MSMSYPKHGASHFREIAEKDHINRPAQAPQCGTHLSKQTNQQLQIDELVSVVIPNRLAISIMPSISVVVGSS